MIFFFLDDHYFYSPISLQLGTSSAEQGWDSLFCPEAVTMINPTPSYVTNQGREQPVQAPRKPPLVYSR